MNRADWISITLVFLWIIPEIIRMAYTGIATTRLSPAVEGGIKFSEMPELAQALYGIGFVGKYACLLAAVAFMAMAARNISKGIVFDETNARLMAATSGAALSFFIFRLAFEGMGNNMMAAQYGIEHWFEDFGAGTPMSDLAPAFILGIMAGMLATILRRGAKLEEDVDGLV